MSVARPKFVQVAATTLAAPITAEEVSEIVLQNLKDTYGNQILMASFWTTAYITLEPGTKNEEIIGFGDFTVNDDNTVSIDTDIERGLAAVSPYGTTGTPRNHAAGSVVVVSNNPQFYEAILAYVEDVTVSGAPNASLTAKGIVEMSTTAEIDAGTQSGATGADLAVRPDQLAASIYNTRLPSSGQKDALAGSSGTPGSGNKYVTEADVSAGAVANKIVRASGVFLPPLDGSALLNISLVTQRTAGVALTALQAVSIGYYQSDGGLLFDNKATGSGSASGGGLTASAFTVGSHTNRAMVIFLTTSGSNDVSSATCTVNGVSATFIDHAEDSSDSGVKARGCSFVIFAPATGSVSVVFGGLTNSQSYTYDLHSYYNVTQSQGTHATGHASRSNAGSGTDLSFSATPAVIGAIAVASGGANTYFNASGTGGDSGIIIPLGAYTVAKTVGNGGAEVGFIVMLYPVTAPAASVIPSSAAATSAATYWSTTTYKTNFVGFVTGSVSAGATASVLINGIITGLSGLAIGSVYYLSDTNGAVSTTAGTNSRKVGIAVSTTEILIANAA